MICQGVGEERLADSMRHSQVVRDRDGLCFHLIGRFHLKDELIFSLRLAVSLEALSSFFSCAQAWLLRAARKRWD